MDLLGRDYRAILRSVALLQEAEGTKKSVVGTQSRTDQSEEIAAFLGGGVTTSMDPGLPPPQDDAVPAQSRTDTGLPPPQGEPGPGVDPGLPPPQAGLGMGPGTDVGIRQQDSVEDAAVASYKTPLIGDQTGGVPADQSETVVAGTDLTATDVALAQVLPPGNAPPPYEPSAPPPMVTPTMTGAMMATPPMVHPSMLQQMPPGYNQMAIPSQTGLHPLPPAQMTPPEAQVSHTAHQLLQRWE